MDSRYLIIDKAFIVTWYAPFQHASVSEALGRLKVPGFATGNVTSAGCYDVKNGKIIITGGSYSMKLDSDPHDAELLARHLGLVPARAEYKREGETNHVRNEV